jgi:transcriptional regulator
MALHVPRAFRVDDAAAIHALIDEHPFATLVTPASPEPLVSHVPLLRDRGDTGLTLLGHFARANPHWAHAAQAPSMAIFHGPHAYVSPTWYADPANAVPTWNFATVHVHGRLDVLPSAQDAERVLRTLVERFEGTDENAWRFSMQGRQREAMVSNIVAFRIVAEQIGGKFKLSQNRTPADRRRVTDALGASDHAESRATGDWMRRFAASDD